MRKIIPIIPIIALIALGVGGPTASAASLSRSECNTIVSQALAFTATAAAESDFRAGVPGALVKMHIACMNRKGKVLAMASQDDAWEGSFNVAKAKAFTAMAFSSDENALTTHTIFCATQPGGPLWHLGNINGPTRGGIKEHGIIEFPGGVPLYKGGKLVGGIGVSGDSVRLDALTAEAGAAGFEPDPAITSLSVLGIPYAQQDDTNLDCVVGP